MNGNDGSTRRDFDPDDAPDLSRDGWPDKFARAPVRGWQTRIDAALRDWIASREAPR